jgi:hypothetical protein
MNSSILFLVLLYNEIGYLALHGHNQVYLACVKELCWSRSNPTKPYNNSIQVNPPNLSFVTSVDSGYYNAGLLFPMRSFYF